MPEILPAHAPYPKAVIGWDGTVYRVFSVDAAGQLQVDVIASGLPAGAATAANQALILAQVQAIEDLTHAQQSIATDRLIVRGEDQLFSFQNVAAGGVTAVVGGVPLYITGPVVPAGEVWVLTNVKAVDRTSATTGYDLGLLHNAVNRWFAGETRAIAAGQRSYWHGHVYLDPGDAIRFYPAGAIAGDQCNVTVTGYIMTLEV